MIDLLGELGNPELIDASKMPNLKFRSLAICIPIPDSSS
jgi:hypothetical protein